uniref:HECT-type E3 ubiquitin transferase n=1 Tax=Kwoniella bestiolae CBS 10118 TaxID=1296100 RepID=A0A1B9G097_9TREE|nr:E3 ubiquitin-protein ligase TRIP12 [Kwoniella bestiolae CBS 10118]OCF24446.1 E3 ubiquitin-protein ligase TRIP12 [Kwoniella bestiolae CBS 10118]
MNDEVDTSQSQRNLNLGSTSQPRTSYSNSNINDDQALSTSKLSTTNNETDPRPTRGKQRRQSDIIPPSQINEPAATRRSARLSIGSNTAPTSELLGPNPGSSTGGKGKKRVHIEEIPPVGGSKKKSRASLPKLPASSDPAESPSTLTGSDRKGKKRAPRSPTPPASDPAPPTTEAAAKRTKRASVTSIGSGRYDLRHKSEEEIQTTTPTTSAKGKGKAKAITKGKGKGKKAAYKMPKKASSKQKRPTLGSSSDRTKKGDTSARHLVDDQMDEDDSLWMDEPSGSGRGGLLDDEDDEEHMEGSEHDDEEEDEDEDDDDGEGDAGHSGGGPGGNAYDRLARLASDTGLHLDEATAAAIFGGGFRAFGGMMSGLSNRFKQLKINLKSKNVATRLAALRECSELLLVSNEDTLGGAFSPTSFATEFIAILNGKPNIDEDQDSGDENQGLDEMDEDAQLAAALAMSSGGMMPSGDQDDMECQLLACRCLAHLMEALPGSGHTLVHLGAVPILCSKLAEITYIELAEQTLSTLEKISAEYPAAIVREGGLGALLNYLPFFSTNVQRTAVTAAANCCRNISNEHYSQIKEVFPTLRDTLSSGDQRLVEQATLAVVRTIESYRHNAEHLEGLLEVPTIAAINALLMPSGGSPLVSPSTYTHLLKALTTSARGSAKVSLAFLEAGMTSTIYQILTGVLPPEHDEDEQGGSSGGQGLAGGIADMAVLQNLAHRPKDQVEEALGLICELLPPTPREGVFDSKGYSEKNLARVKKGRKADRPGVPRRSSRVAEAASGTPTAPTTPSGSNAPLPADTVTPTAAAPTAALTREAAMLKAMKEATAQMDQRLELLKSNPEIIGKFIKAVVPVLVDVYAASVVFRVRTKVLNGLVKAIAFADPEQLKSTLRSVPMASFLCAIISSKDNPTFVQHALQLVELLATKLPEVYQASFLREGVVFEIDALAEQEMAKEKAAKEAALVKTEPEENQESAAGPSTSTPTAVSAVPEDLKPLISLAGLSGGISLLETLSGPSTPKRSSSSYLDPSDANIVRARMLQAKKVFDVGGDHHQAASQVLDEISAMVQKLCRPEANEAELRDTLRDIASRFSNVDQALSSFELLKSGLVDGLLEFVDIDGEVTSSDRRLMLFEVFSDTSLSTPSPLTMLVKRLHESLGRLENFDVEIAFGGGTDASRPSASSLSRTMRIRLQAEEGEDIPKQVSTLSVTIQAIASMQALNDYLRPRVADGNYGSGLSRMFAAYAADSSVPTAGSSVPAAFTSADAKAQPTEKGEEEKKGETSSKPQRRRSARLSAQGIGESSTSASAPAAEPSTPAAIGGVPGSGPSIFPHMPMDMDFDEDDYSEEEEYGHEVSPCIGQITMNVELMGRIDGSRVEAKTPEGTRIATPQQNPPAATATAGPSGSGAATPRGSSYAGAVKTAPTDWHLEFNINGNKLSLNDTLYGAVHRNQEAISGGNPAGYGGIYSMPVTIKFRKVEGPAKSDTPLEAPSPASVTSSFPAGLEPGTPTSKILRLLRVVHNLSVDGKDALGISDNFLDENLFVNNKLTAKLTRQLEETMIIASDCLPEWAVELPKHFSFLFPFDTRYNFLQSTSFGYGRLISRSQPGGNSRNGRRDDVSHLARLVRQKVRISRSQLLESCAKVLEIYGTSTGILEIEYFDEIGTGLGPTLEFYSLASKEFARRALGIWRDEDETKDGNYVFHPKGLFPAPLNESVNGSESKLSWYKTLGLFAGRALLDSRIIDVNLNRVFLKLILGQPVKKTIATLKAIDTALARSLERLQTYLFARKEIEALKLPASTRRTKLAALTVGGAKLADLSLDFTLPGYSIELKPGGSHIDVDDSNLEEYLEKVLEMTLGTGVEKQVKAFQEGFSLVFSVREMRIFSPEELGLLFGNAEEDWSRETLEQSLKADHGYNLDSRAVQNLLEVMVGYDKEQRRQFLQFITGAPKLPIGGFKGLTPPFTVVRKPHEPPFKADDYLPSVMTCAQYLKMPDYSTKEVLAAQIERAMKDGGGSFHLS